MARLGSTQVLGTLNVTRGATISGALSSGAIAATGNSTVTGTLNVSSTTTISGELDVLNKRSDFGQDTSWNAVGATNLTNVHFQAHPQFWVGAGNGTWFTGTANTKTQASGLAADAASADDLLVTTMVSTSTQDRGITFAVDSLSGGSVATSGWRLGKWHSGDAADASKLVVDGAIFAKGGYTDEYDYYVDDYSAYFSAQGGTAGWVGPSNAGWHSPSIVASTAIQIQSGNLNTNARKPQLQFHQYGYGGPSFEYDGPNKIMTLGTLGTATLDYFSTFEIDVMKPATDTISYPLTLNVQSSGTPAAGIGTGIEFRTETAAGNTEIGARIESIATDVTSTSEGFALAFDTMTAGAAPTEKMRITAAGNVGIGTNNPGRKLDVVGSLRTTGGIDNESSAGGNSHIGLETSSNVFQNYITTRAGKTFFRNYDGSGYTTNVTVDGPNSRLGVGTDSPGATLDVKDTILLTNSANTQHGLMIENRSTFFDSSGRAGIWSSSGALGGAFSGEGAHLVIEGRKNSARDIYIKVGDTTSASHVFKASGNVGIGTTSPASRLHVVSEEIGLGGNKGLRIQNWDNTQNYSIRTGITGSNNSTLSVYDETNSANRITVTSAGNVGIGINAPTTKLHVVGDLTVQSTYPRIDLTDTDNNSDFSIVNDNGRLNIYDNTNGVNRMTFAAAGNVGIGTATPGSILHVKNATPEIKLEPSATTDNGTIRYNSTTKSIEFIFG
jgi:hypothetical protein